jgi:hypothetical protein
LAERRIPRIAEREDEYRGRRLNRKLSPERVDLFADGMCRSNFYLLIHLQLEYRLKGFYGLS